jgi:hypothetical protein
MMQCPMFVNVGFTENYFWPISASFASVLAYDKLLWHLKFKSDSIIDFKPPLKEAI